MPAFVELADTLVADFDIIDSLTALSARCVELLDIAVTGILLADSDGQLRVIAASGEQARRLEPLQIQTDKGPHTKLTDLATHIGDGRVDLTTLTTEFHQH